VEAVGGDLAHKLDLLETRGVINATLKDTATMTMSSDDDALLANRVKDELSILSLEVVEALLNDVVAVQVLDELDDLSGESVDDHLDLLKS
jgi:hypothetical protein